MNDLTYYVAARDERGNRIGLYVEADDADSAWDLAQERADIGSRSTSRAMIIATVSGDPCILHGALKTDLSL